jgi:glycosyltransferase involved in cell wall biosynthesis
MMAYAFYESDNRILRYAETLAKRGDEVEVLALRRGDLPKFEVLNGVSVHRIQHRERNEKGKLIYLLRLLRFWFKSCWVVSLHHLRRRFDVVHIHSVPDFEVFAGWFPKLLGAKLILDIHDIVPELYATKFGVRPGSLAFRLLVLMEKASCAFADHVIVANHIWRDRLVERSAPARKCSVVMNHVDLNVFGPRVRQRTDDRKIILYPGILSRHQGVDIAIRAVALAREQVPNLEFHIYGDGAEKEPLRKLADELGLSDVVFVYDPVPIHEVARLMAETDLGVEPKRADTFANEAYSTKVLEYMSQKVPVIVSRTRVHEHYFDESTVLFFASGDAADLARQMVTLFRAPALRQTLVANGLALVERQSWHTRQSEYLRLIDDLVGTAGPVEPRRAASAMSGAPGRP